MVGQFLFTIMLTWIKQITVKIIFFHDNTVQRGANKGHHPKLNRMHAVKTDRPVRNNVLNIDILPLL